MWLFCKRLPRLVTIVASPALCPSVTSCRMYRSAPSDKHPFRSVVTTLADALQEVAEALPWLELALFAMLVLGLALT